MSKLTAHIAFFLLMVLLLLEAGCTNEINIENPGEGLPVIHFILDPYEDAYYALVTKSGLSGRNIFNSMDSAALFYPNSIELTLELWNDSVRLWYSDFSSITSTKDPGFFPQGEGYLYQCNNTIPKKDSLYGFQMGYPVFRYFRIILVGEDFKETAYSRVAFGDYPEIVKPSFTDQNVRLYGPSPYLISWNPGLSVRYFELNFRFHYYESMLDGRKLEKKVEFIYAKDVQSSSSDYQVYINPDLFFKKLSQCFDGNSDSVAYRQFKSFDIVLAGGDSNFEDYQAHNKLSIASEMMPWTNIINGLGIFSLKYVKTKEQFRFHQETIDSLSKGRYTKSHKFIAF